MLVISKVFFDQIEKHSKSIELPALILSEESFLTNLHFWSQNAKKKIRIATKSIRSRQILDLITSTIDSKLSGLMCYDPREALWLANLGKKNILFGYPTTQEKIIVEIINSTFFREITFTVDLIEHLEILKRNSTPNKKINICIDIDSSYRFFGIHFGVMRSSLSSLSKIEKILQYLKDNLQYFNLNGIMTYEAQLAGVPDTIFLNPLKKFAIKFLKNRSTNHILHFRKKIHSLIQDFSYSFFNAGGTGNFLDLQNDPIVNEVTLGSGLYGPNLFDHYNNFSINSSLIFALECSRNPQHLIYTLTGGGYVASGALFPHTIPKIIFPKEINLLPNESVGEVQTPIYSKNLLKIGSMVFLKHSKAGEILERFNYVNMINKNNELNQILTYRGENKCFL